MLSLFRRIRILVPFINQRLVDYAKLARFDLIAFRNETIRAIIAAVICAAAVLLLLCFVGVAIIVTEWETPNRIITAWVVCIGWCVVAAGGAFIVRHVLSGSSPFDNIEKELLRDLSVIKELHEHSSDERSST